MKEVWKDIPGYNGLYQASNLGRVRSLDRVVCYADKNGVERKRTFHGCVLSQHQEKSGYMSLGLTKERKKKTFLTHQLVAMAFLDHKPSKSKMVVDHLNNIKTDNKVKNLQITTQRLNASKDKFRKNYTSKYVGVHLRGEKWVASITVKNKSRHLGFFDDEYEAHLAYQNKLKEI